MRFHLLLAVLALCLTCASQAQRNIDIGPVSPPVLKAPDTSDAENTEGAPEQDSATGGNSIGLPGMDLMPNSKMDFEMDFGSFEVSTRYRTLEITEPVDNSTIRIHANNVHIKANVVPPVRQDLGHTLQITLDNQPLIENQTSFMLDDAERGAHVIGLRIIDSDGNTILQANDVRILIR